MEKKFNRVDSTGSIQERANLIADATKQLPWFHLKGPETLDFLFYLTYQRFLLRFPTGVFSSWKVSLHALPQQKPTFWDFLDHFFEDLIDAHRIQAIKDFESKPDLDQFMESIAGAAYALSDEEYAEFFEYFLISKMGGDFLTPIFPAPLGKLMAGLFELEPNAIIQNPYAGRGTLIPYLPKNCIYRGKPEDPMDAAILSLRMLVHGFLKEKISKVGGLVRSMEKAAISICLPPFDKEYVAFPPRDGESPEDIPERLIEELLRGVSKTGKVMLVTNDRFLTGSNKASEALQKALVNSGYLATIISLPETLFQFGVAHCSLVVLDKEKEQNGPVTFFKSANATKDSSRRDLERLDVDGTVQKFREKRIGNDVFEIPLKKIIDWNFKLSPNKAMAERIIQQEEAQLDLGVQFVNLGDILEKVHPISALINHLSKITIGSIQHRDPLNHLTDEDLENLEIAVGDEKGFNAMMIEGTTLLVPRLGSKVFPIILDVDAAGLAVHSSIMCFRMKVKQIDLEYLVLELHSHFVQKQIEALHSNAMLLGISSKDFVSIKVRIDYNIRRQRRRVEEFKQASLVAKMEELKLHQKMLGLEQTEHQILAVIGHELRPIIYKVQKQAEWIGDYIAKKEANKELVSINDPIAPGKSSKSIQKTLAAIVQDMSTMGKRFDSLQALLDVESKKGELEIVSLNDFWWMSEAYGDDLWNRPFFLHHHFFPAFTPECDHLMVRVNKTLFKTAIDNLVRNAEVHGFDPEMEENKVFICTSCYQQEDGSVWVAVDCLNNGKPFPQDFKFEEFIKYGSRGEDSQGTGVGGFLINRIVQNANGIFRLLDQDEMDIQIATMKSQSQEAIKKLVYGDRPYTVGFRIELPYSFENDETVD